MSHAPHLAMPHTGDIVGGRYILRERIGAGGMGRVFRARDEVLARDVAIKIFHADGADGSEPLRRLAEARALAALDHTSLVTLYDARLVGEEHVYLVMELIAGPSLQRRIEQEAIPATELAGFLSDLAGALAVAHDAGIVHRDVKPSNVLLRPLHAADRAAEAVLADFGVAHLIDATRLTTPGTVIGTAAYLAPEQVRGEAPQAASDIYALGLLAIEALTRLHPFGAGSLQENLLARLARQPSLPDTLSARWRRLLGEMTAADPASRPTATEVAARAESLARDEHPPAADATGTLPLWTLATAPIGVGRLAPAAGVTVASMETASTAAASPGTAPSPPTSAPATEASGAGDERVDAARPRRDHGRRSRRRGGAWAAISVGAALVVGGHLAAFSLGAAGDVSSDGASVPAATPVPSRDAATPSDAPATSAEPSEERDTAPSSSPAAPAPTEPEPVVVQPVTVVSTETGAGGARPGGAVAGDTSTGGPATDGGSAGTGSARAGTRGTNTDPAVPGRGAAEDKGRPDSPGASDDAGKGRGPGPKQK